MHADGVVIELNDPRVHEWWTPTNMRSDRIARKEISLECSVPYGWSSYTLCTQTYCQCTCHDTVALPEGLI